MPPRGLEGGIGLARGMFRGLAGEALSLEVATSAPGPRWYLRAETEAGLQRALGGLRAAYPQARAELLPGERPDLDPARLLGPERAVAVELLPRRERALPLRGDWRHEPDPLAGLLAGIVPGPGERVVARLTLGPPPGGAAGRIRRRAAPAARPPQAAGPGGPGPLPLAGLLAAVAGGAQGWRWYAEGEWGLLAAGGAAVFVALPLAGAVAFRLRRAPDPLPPRAAEQKLAAPLVSARLEITAAGGGSSSTGRLRELAAAAASRLRRLRRSVGRGAPAGAPAR